MRWQEVPVVGGAYSDDSKPWSAQDTVNWLPEVAERPGGRSPVMLRSAPGLLSFSLPEAAPVRGLHNVEGRLLAVVGRTLYRIGTNGVPVSIGTIPGVGRVSIAHNQVTGGNEAVIVNGQNGYVYRTTDDTLTQITDEGFPGAKVVDFVDGYIVGVEPFGRFWFHSDLAAAAEYNTLDRSEAEAQPDRIVTLIVTHRDVLVFGERSAEFFYNTGEATGTFQRRDGTEMEVGCAATHSAARVDNSVCWLGHDGCFYRLNGYQPVRISTHAIEQAISRSTWKDCFAVVYEDRGHKIVYWTFPDGQTWGYDVATQEWHRRQSKGMDRWRVNALVRWNRQWIAGDFRTGRLSVLDWDTPTENGNEMERRRVSGVLHNQQNRVTVNAVELKFDVGYEVPKVLDVPTRIGFDWKYTGLVGRMLFDVTVGNGLFVAVGGDPSYPAQVFTSTDGDTWTQRTTGVPTTWVFRSVAYGNGLFVASRDFSSVITSPDGINWTQRSTSNGSAYLVTLYANGHFIRAGFNESAERSADGISWSTVLRPSINTARVGVVHGNVALFFCEDGAIHRTADGGATYTTPTIASDPVPANNFTGAASDGTTIRAYKYASGVLYTYTSSDAGASWTVRQDTVGSSNYQAGKALYRNGNWFALGATTTGGQQVTLWRSTDGLVPWEAAEVYDYTDTTAATMQALTADANRAVLVGVKTTDGYAMTSPSEVAGETQESTLTGSRKVNIRYGRDGRRWSDWRVHDLGGRVVSRRFGSSREFVFDISITDSCRVDLLAASIQMESA